MRPGPAPIPSALKILRGNRGRKPLNKQEAQPPAGMPKMPDVLSPEAREEWAWLAPVLLSCGLLTKADGIALAMLCNAWSDYCRTRRKGKAAGQFFIQVKQLLPEFGLTPASRSRIKVEMGKPLSKVDEFRAKHGG